MTSAEWLDVGMMVLDKSLEICGPIYLFLMASGLLRSILRA